MSPPTFPQPNPSADTRSPVLPSSRYSMGPSCEMWLGGDVHRRPPGREHTAPHRPWSRKAPLERSRDRALRTPSGFAYHQPRLAGSPTIGRGSRTRDVEENSMGGGARSFADVRYPIQRLFRDQHALAGHIGFSWDAQGAPWGLVILGGEFSSPTL